MQPSDDPSDEGEMPFDPFEYAPDLQDSSEFDVHALSRKAVIVVAVEDLLPLVMGRKHIARKQEAVRVHLNCALTNLLVAWLQDRCVAYAGDWSAYSKRALPDR